MGGVNLEGVSLGGATTYVKRHGYGRNNNGAFVLRSNGSRVPRPFFRFCFRCIYTIQLFQRWATIIHLHHHILQSYRSGRIVFSVHCNGKITTITDGHTFVLCFPLTCYGNAQA